MIPSERVLKKIEQKLKDYKKFQKYQDPRDFNKHYTDMRINSILEVWDEMEQERSGKE